MTLLHILDLLSVFVFALVGARVAADRGYGRFQWWVLDWNTPAIDFYTSLGAKAMDEWTVYRISGKELNDLAVQDR